MMIAILKFVEDVFPSFYLPLWRSGCFNAQSSLNVASGYEVALSGEYCETLRSKKLSLHILINAREIFFQVLKQKPYKILFTNNYIILTKQKNILTKKNRLPTIGTLKSEK